MNKASRLLSISILVAVLLAASAVWTLADAPEADIPADAPSDALPPEETDAGAESMAPVDVPASAPGGTVYAVGNSGSIAVTVVDYTADGADAGVHFDGQSRYYYGAQITGADNGAVISGASVCYFGASDGSIPLYDAKGGVSGIVWGGCRPTTVDCGVGLLLDGDVTGGILVEDGASFTCRESVVLCSAGSGSFRFHNARLSSGSGVLLQMELEAGSVSVTYEYGSYSGDLINGSDSPLFLTVGRGALLFGDTVRTSGPVEVTVDDGAVWVVDQRTTLTHLTIEDGATVYGELLDPGSSSLILFPSDQVLEPGTYEAEALTESLPMGHGPALPAESSPEEDAEDTAAQDAERAKRLFPLAPAAAAAEEVEPDSTATDSTADDVDEDYDRRLFQLAPAAPAAAETATEEATAAPAPSEAPEPSETPEPSGDASASGACSPTLPDIAQMSACHSLSLGIGLASPTALQASVRTITPFTGFAACLAVRTTGQPPTVSLLKTGVKNHSFLPQALDNRGIILYNPYCCSAA